jgi:hypothetical protein
VAKRGFFGSSVALVATVAIVFGGSILSANGAPLTSETFQNGAVADPSVWVNGGTGAPVVGQWPGVACLTAGDNISATPIPGCANPALDTPGSGVLRLTTNAGDETGFALFNSPISAAGGLDIAFTQYQWGGDGADGISFFIVDGSTNLTTPGAPGGSLGYSTDGVVPGVTNGLVGVGLDAFGNFSDPAYAGTGCAAGSGAGSAGPGAQANRIAIRGPGSGAAGFCWLGSSSAVTLRASTRAPSSAVVRIVLDPATVTTRNVTVYLNGTQVLQVPAPAALLAASTFKFGFAASTGGSTDNHEVCCLSVNEAPPPTVGAVPVVTGPSFTG